MDGNGHPHTESPVQANLSEQQQVSEPVQVVAAPVKQGRSFEALARRLNLDKLAKNIDWRTYVIDFVYLATVLLVASGFLYWKFYMNGMATKSLTVGGYTYSFDYVRSASATQNSNGMRGYTTDFDHSALIGPVAILSQQCTGSSSQYTIAFTVHVYGDTRPVCKSQDSQGNQIYTLSFASQNRFHEFMVTDGNTANTNAYPKLKTIFGSVTVSQQNK